MSNHSLSAVKLAQSFDPVHEHLQKTDHGTMETCREGMSVEDSLILKLVNYYRVYERDSFGVSLRACSAGL